MNPIATITRPTRSTLDFTALRSRFTGALHVPGDPEYDEQRRPLRPDIDPFPALVVEAAHVTDVRAAVRTARELGLPFAVQATGHGTHRAADGALLLKTSGLASVLVDPDRRIARVGGGVRWSQVLQAAAPFGLAPLSGSSPTVGVTGYTLGGGVGWLARKHGFAADSVVRAEVVTADGRVVTTGPDQYPDLFWALRGGGGNFGVVTSLEFRLHPVDTVHAGFLYFPIDGAAETLSAYRNWVATAPKEISTAAVLKRMPDTAETPEALRGRSVVMLKVMHDGPADEARKLIAPVVRAAGPVLHDELRTVRYADAAMGGTAARYFDYFRTLPDEAIATVVAAHAANDSTVEIRHWGGAMAETGPDAGPVGHRDAEFSVILDAPGDDTADRLALYAIGGAFLNFLADPAKVERAYTGENLRRLREVKRFYDPENFFSVNHNIAPRTFARPSARLRRAA
ncbi:MAG: FAD-binding oxidoreductase [Hamadaea sp.]|nr:FAD-binding oxidoreductase [Hamadaea sp.]